jgi:hypothetical protein
VLRAKAVRRKRRAAEEAKPAGPAATPERTADQRRRDLVALLLRVAEAQTRALEAREAPVPASELKAVVDLLERLQRMQAAGADHAPEEEGRSLTELRDEFFRHLCRIRAERGIVDMSVPSAEDPVKVAEIRPA